MNTATKRASISGFTFIRNGTMLGFPFVESIRSLLPLVDEFVVAVGRSDDDTLERVRGIGDARFKIIETGWNTSNSRLGAPTGFVGHDFPLGGENLHYLAIKVISWFSSDPFLVLNLYFFGSFALCAASAVVALRVLGLRRLVAHPLALLFAFVPAHLLRGPSQVTLASMFTVPLACIILVWAMGPLPLVLRHVDGRVRPAHNARLIALALMVVLLGSGGAYYALFTVVLLAIIGSLSAMSRRSWMHLASAAMVAMAIVVVLAANSLPSLLYQRSHGHNPMAMYRSASQLDSLSLRPVKSSSGANRAV